MLAQKFAGTLAAEVLLRSAEVDQDGAVDSGTVLVNNVIGHGGVSDVHHAEGADILGKAHSLLVGPDDVTGVRPHLSPRLRRDRVILVAAVAKGDVVDAVNVMMLLEVIRIL